MSREFFIPKKILSGDGALGSLSELITECGKKALIVTGKNVRQLPCFASLCDMLTEKNILFTVFDGITGEPDDIMIESGAELYRKEGCDFLIAIGGGSPANTVKEVTKADIVNIYKSLFD